MQVSIDVPPWARRVASDLTDLDRAPQPVDPERAPSFDLELPDDVYFEYGFLDAEGRLRADPANPRRAENPWYRELSALAGPAYRPDALAEPPAPAAPPAVDRLRVASEALHQQRRVIVAGPSGFEDAELPWLLVQDGVAFYRLARLADVLAALVAAGEARPARIAFVEPVERAREYAFHPAYRTFVERELLAELERRYRSSGELIALGASLGGLFSATLALERPDLVSGVATFSGAFLGGPDDRDFYRSERSWVARTLEERGAAAPRWYAACGTLEWLTDVNRRVARALEAAGVDHAYAERNAGHNWTNWRNVLADALRFVLRP